MTDAITSPTAGQLFHDGRLNEAVRVAGEAVQHAPAELARRVLLAELLVFSGAWERADTVLDAAEAADPDAGLIVAEFRQLLRAAAARRAVARQGRMPEFLGAPTVAQTLALEALVALRAGDARAALASAAAMELARPALRGSHDGAPFEEFRDADDLGAATFEVLTTTGKYFWIAGEQLASLRFHAPKRPRDLFWRRCSIDLRNGTEGDVYIPMLYDTVAGSGPPDDPLRLGRATSWSKAAPVRGAGQRVFLVGEEGVPATALGALVFA